MDPIFGLAITLPPPGSRHRLRDLHDQLKAAMLDGRLQPGLRLPATRSLAATLGISRNTAVAAYDLLMSEGYLIGRPSAGTYVADILSRQPRPQPRTAVTAADGRLAPFWRHGAPKTIETARSTFAFDFRVGLPDSTLFPFPIWRRLSARALRAFSKAPSDYGDPQGRLDLREAVARHVSFARAVACRPDDVVITSGAQQAFGLLARILVTPNRTVAALEEPGYPPLRAAFAAAGAEISGVGVDEEGLIVDRLPARARIIYVTPSHQFPLGIALSQRRRADLLTFARRNRAVIIEDDYDGEFRFGGRPLDALQTLDRSGSVFYVGTFSKSLFPALRLGFIVAPPWARPALVAARQIGDWHGMELAQAALAAFIGEGHLARHLRKMRRIYGQRRNTLLEALARHGESRLRPIEAFAGLHLAVRLDPAIRASDLARRAVDSGIAVDSLGRYSAARSGWNGLAFGYGTIGAERIDEGIRRLARAMG